ncbi:MAG: hypothetical protein KAT58_00655 [candidate division Zixibacteria bacterium]|nr:hypothetical protein [candidate division Zixibacteria bacterium]
MVKTTTKKRARTRNSAASKKSKEYIYPGDRCGEYLWSDYVRVNSGPRGILLSFGQFHPEVGKYQIIKEILLPYEVAISLRTIIGKQIDALTEKGLIEITNPQKE